MRALAADIATLAVEHGVNTLAFPSISTGVYRYPVERAARIAVREVGVFLGGAGAGQEVSFSSRMRSSQSRSSSAALLAAKV